MLAIGLGLGLALTLGSGQAHALTPQIANAIAGGETLIAKRLRETAKIVPTRRPLQCVPFARKVSGIQIRGDAWTWWTSAKGRYEQGQNPVVGSVLVMRKTKRLRRGHLAVVKEVVNQRIIIVDQANWLNRGQIHLNTAVLDVSLKNDWSAVRVWYTPGTRFGSRTYTAHGFIYPKTPMLRAVSLDALPLPRRRPDRTNNDIWTEPTKGTQRTRGPSRHGAIEARNSSADTGHTKHPQPNVNHILRLREGTDSGLRRG